jgi:hypothetical protein
MYLLKADVCLSCQRSVADTSTLVMFAFRQGYAYQVCNAHCARAAMFRAIANYYKSILSMLHSPST